MGAFSNRELGLPRIGSLAYITPSTHWHWNSSVYRPAQARGIQTSQGQSLSWKIPRKGMLRSLAEAPVKGHDSWRATEKAAGGGRSATRQQSDNLSSGTSPDYRLAR